MLMKPQEILLERHDASRCRFSRRRAYRFRPQGYLPRTTHIEARRDMPLAVAQAHLPSWSRRRRCARFPAPPGVASDTAARRLSAFSPRFILLLPSHIFISSLDISRFVFQQPCLGYAACAAISLSSLISANTMTSQARRIFSRDGNRKNFSSISHDYCRLIDDICKWQIFTSAGFAKRAAKRYLLLLLLT